ncbi:LacI family transcriptional regulator [Actinoplanes lobatus]|uniref:DNA-binding LacI/PurR family transcriptional regulator n=3 Tax=Actinoplanes TaxID=1865 RepID=A0A7W5FCA2_9ACTN|nr:MULTISPECIES: LacI family DNA-binding transcriptional regulator [Actinoplanes]MBB3093219.1 DNA-binding LacI/PurR family transcriptional regulator [Actinoplanes campanulatus]MBB4746806.1 DNA-binding LacI/PurR family transcriptional regulator [Actinoplanes lobatus]MBW6438999.1 LacI family transcriptional regulator [Actinoplanes hulinensis]GGN02040.1 LacI family transcriptional regulator [Actinoplanes campanulatus]GGN54250.1 LacI family transcriptional regulator [Actinoplanes lobatus]
MKRPTIADIARRAGVSKGAVSYALNGQPGVSEATRKRILSIAQEIGFNANSAARALSGARARAVGLTLCRPARLLGIEPWFMGLISGFEAELGERSYALTLQVVATPEQEVEVYRRWWGERRIDGVIVTDIRENDIRIPVLQELQLPAIVIGGPGDTGPIAQIWSDDAGAITEAVRYLVALGHHRIARVSGPPGLLHTQNRTKAFEGVCAALGLDHSITIPADYTGEEGSRATRRLLIGGDRPTAIIYDNDVMAVAGLAVAQEMGLSVPGDLSIVAWDDSPLCSLVHPPLTALSRDISAYGAQAARELLNAIDGTKVGNVEAGRVHLTPRGSTAPPR